MPCEPTLFSVLSWNIEHFRGGDARLKKVAAHIAGQDPDVFGLLEIEHADVLTLMQRELPDYDFALTDGPEVQEILAGWRGGKFGQTVCSRGRECNVGNPALRPGALSCAGWRARSPASPGSRATRRTARRGPRRPCPQRGR